MAEITEAFSKPHEGEIFVRLRDGGSTGKVTEVRLSTAVPEVKVYWGTYSASESWRDADRFESWHKESALELSDYDGDPDQVHRVAN